MPERASAGRSTPAGGPGSAGRIVRVACCQVAGNVADPDAAWPGLVAAVESAASAGAALVVLPELATSGFATGEPALTRAAAEETTGPKLRRLVALSGRLGLVIVAGWAERAGGEVFNAAVVCDRGELRGRYRKAHLWGDEPDHFRPGSEGPLVLDTSVGRLGVMVCYDVEFPEWVRMAADQGAELLAVPVNWPRYELPPPGERDREVFKAQAAAAAYRIPIAIADRCGAEGGLDWVGGTCVVDVTGFLLAGPVTAPGAPASPGLVTADVDLAAAADKSIGPRNDARADRRPELYR